MNIASKASCRSPDVDFVGLHARRPLAALDDGHGSASSAGVVRMAGGDAEIVVAGRASRNWISVAPGRPFALAR